MIVVVLTVLAVALIPVMVGYYLWLGRHIAPRLVFLPPRLAIAVLGFWVALPWLLGTVAVVLLRT